MGDQLTTPGAVFGPVEHFGDMDRNQRYVILIRNQTPESADLLEKTTFEVSHESTWGFGRRKSTIQVRGLGWRGSLEVGAATPIGEIADTVKKQEQQLKKIGEAITTVGQRLRPPLERRDT